MNTRRQIRRYEKRVPKEPGHAVETALKDPSWTMMLGALVANFTHLEMDCSFLLARLMGTDWQSAFILLSTINSASTREAALRAILEESPRNAGLGPDYDDLLSDFLRINRARNRYVHGVWTTDCRTQKVYLNRVGADISALSAMNEPSFSEMGQLLLDIGNCRRRILELSVGVPERPREVL